MAALRAFLAAPFILLCACAELDHHGRNPYRNGYDRDDYYRHSYDRDYSRGYSRDYGYNDDRAIREGVRSGDLTRRELNDLRDDQREIQRDRDRAAADGVITNREREEIRDDINDYHDDLNHNLRDGERR